MHTKALYQKITRLQKTLKVYLTNGKDLSETIDDVWLESLIKELEILQKNL